MQPIDKIHNCTNCISTFKYAKCVASYILSHSDIKAIQFAFSVTSIVFGVFNVLSANDMLSNYLSENYVDVLMTTLGSLQLLNMCLPETHKHRINEFAALFISFTLSSIWSFVVPMYFVCYGLSADKAALLIPVVFGWWSFTKISIPNILCSVHGGRDKEQNGNGRGKPTP